ncbi:MAG: flagellar hook-length control protein FliK, partial [Pusillimonas sp.]
MSVGGPSALGTLLVQRLDAVLGTTLAQQTNLASGARPDAVSQPGQPLSPDAAQNQTGRDTRTAVDKTLEQTEQQLRQAVAKTKLDAQQALFSARDLPATSSTPSAPTTLGAAAKAILALLIRYPEQAPALTAKAPLVTASPEASQGNTNPSPATVQNSAGGASTAANTANATASSTAANQQPAQSTGTGGASAAGAQSAVTPASISPLQLAAALTQALQTSGLFYESHLSNVAFGKQSAASVLIEPQAQLAQNTPISAATTTTTAVAQTPPSPAGTAPPTQAVAALVLPDQTQSNALAGLHPDTYLLVRQQLEVLANQALAWRGQAWPGAPLDWEVRRDEGDASPDSESGDSHWATRLTLNLPRLGEVQARISLSGQQMVMKLIAPESAD